MPNPVVHFEIMGGDPAAQQKFYADLFGWAVQATGPDMGGYGVVDTNGGSGINGGIGVGPEGTGSYTMVYAAVPDMQATLDKAESLGGKVVVPVTEIPNVVTFAVLLDRQGNMMGLVNDMPPGADAPSGPTKGRGAPLTWFEISSADPKDARAFYTELFGWNVSSETEGEYTYYELDTDERGTRGAIASSADGASHVTLWAHVHDLQAKLDEAKSLGAKPVMEPTKVNDRLTVAGFIDLAGNFFGIFNS